MASITLDVYHTQSHTARPLSFPVLATGFENWLGDGYYFWQDYQFSIWWGKTHKCGTSNKSRQFIVYRATLIFDSEEFIDTVFNEEDYYQFCKNIEKFAKAYQKNLGRKPSLQEFNSFIEHHHVWDEIKVIRFQDLPESDYHVEVLGFYYKKRIQLRVNDPKIISTFAVHKTFACL